MKASRACDAPARRAAANVTTHQHPHHPLGLTLDHDALADDQVPHIEGGWSKMYWEPLRAYLQG
jgi:hypothetical protein